MKNNLAIVLTVIFVSVFILVSANSQEDMEQVNHRVFKNPKRISAVFRHDEHNEKAGLENCRECHHVYENGKEIEDESSEDQYCSDCHELKASDRTPALMKAFHMNCKGCHLDRKQGPVTCGECHKK